jgi:signal transduction histidine kinase
VTFVTPRRTTRIIEHRIGDAIPEILIVDADAESRAELRTLIAPVARVTEVGSGEEALELAPSRELAAILIDVDLPDSDGFTTITRLRLDPQMRNIPVLFLSYEVPEWFCEQRGYELGALGYLRKPIDAIALRAKLDVLLTLYRRGVELRKKTMEAEVKDIYIGVLGHDLRTPLSAILMTARTLLMRGKLEETERTQVSRMARNAERMASLIRDVLDYTRNHATGGLPINRRTCDMGDVCSEIIEDLQLLHPDRKIHLSTSGILVGSWDRERIEQVITNLLSNAVSHGRGDINVVVQPTPGTPGAVVVSVHNHGEVIAPDDLPHLFEPFKRGSESRLGLGLGLYIVQVIVQAHGGKVEVASNAISGTTFTTRWPRT